MSSCSEAPKKKLLWLIPYTSSCDFELTAIYPWGAYHWHTYESIHTCKWCGARKRDFGLDESDAIWEAVHAGGKLINGRFKKD